MMAVHVDRVEGLSPGEKMHQIPGIRPTSICEEGNVCHVDTGVMKAAPVGFAHVLEIAPDVANPPLDHHPHAINVRLRPDPYFEKRLYAGLPDHFDHLC